MFKASKETIWRPFTWKEIKKTSPWNSLFAAFPISTGSGEGTMFKASKETMEAFHLERDNKDKSVEFAFAAFPISTSSVEGTMFKSSKETMVTSLSTNRNVKEVRRMLGGNRERGVGGIRRLLQSREGTQGRVQVPHSAKSFSPSDRSSSGRNKGIKANSGHEQHHTQQNHQIGGQGRQPGRRRLPSGLDASLPHCGLKTFAMPFRNEASQLEVLPPGEQ